MLQYMFAFRQPKNQGEIFSYKKYVRKQREEKYASGRRTSAKSRLFQWCALLFILGGSIFGLRGAKYVLSSYTTGAPVNYRSTATPAAIAATGYTTGQPISYSMPSTGYTTGQPTGFTSGQPIYYPTQPTGYTTGDPVNYSNPVTTTPIQPTGYTTGLPVGYTNPGTTAPVQPTGYTTGQPIDYSTGQPLQYPSSIPVQYTTGDPVNYTNPSAMAPVQPTGYTTGQPIDYTTGQPLQYPSTQVQYTTGQPVNYTVPNTATTIPATGYTTGEPVNYAAAAVVYTSGQPVQSQYITTALPSGTIRTCIDNWIKKFNLNQYGDPRGTVYPGGTPLFNEATGQRIDKYQYIMMQHTDQPWLSCCPNSPGMRLPMQNPTTNSAMSVSMQNFQFMPGNIVVPVGTTVSWVNQQSGVPHTTTSDSRSGSEVWDSGMLQPGQSFSHTFRTRGTFTYHCNVHPMMMGSVTVQ